MYEQIIGYLPKELFFNSSDNVRKTVLTFFVRPKKVYIIILKQ